MNHRKSNDRAADAPRRFAHFRIWISALFRVSDFGFRISAISPASGAIAAARL
jgi:hypothetical protein